MKLFKNSEKKVLIQCPYATDGSKDFCKPGKPFTLNMSSPDFQQMMEAHVQQHMERDSSMFGLTIKKFGCPICPWESKPFQSNSALALKALGKEEMEAMVDLDDHITGNRERVENLVQWAQATENPEEKAQYIQWIEDYRGHQTCTKHETPGHELLTYYFRDKEELELHTKLLHLPKVKPINPKIKRQ